MATEWTMLGTHTGQFLDLTSTGKPVQVDGVDIFRFSGGNYTENWSFADELPLWRRLGVIPVKKDVA